VTPLAQAQLCAKLCDFIQTTLIANRDVVASGFGTTGAGIASPASIRFDMVLSSVAHRLRSSA